MYFEYICSTSARCLLDRVNGVGLFMVRVDVCLYVCHLSRMYSGYTVARKGIFSQIISLVSFGMQNFSELVQGQHFKI